MSLDASNNTTSAATLTVSLNSCRECNCWDSFHNILSFEARKIHDKVVQCGFIPSLFLTGAPANILSMIVFYRQGLRDRMNLCLFCLAFTDLMYVTAVLTMVSYCFIDIFVPEQALFWRLNFIKNSLAFANSFAYSSGFLTMIIAVERCVCVMFPMKVATLISTKAMAVILTTSLLLIQGLCSVYIVKEKLVHIKNEVTGVYIPVLVNTEVFLKHPIFKAIENIVLSFISFVTFVVVILTTALTLMRLNSAATWRKTTASGDSYLKRQAVLMRMLVVVSCIYILCSAPNIALALTRFTVPEFRADGTNCNIFVVAHFIGFAIVLINSSVNFFIYFTMSSRFRHELKSLCWY